MRPQRIVLGIVLAMAVLATLGAAAPRSSAGPPRRPALAPCKSPGMPAGTLCGTYEVFENRASRTGRKIALRFVVLPATGRGRLPDPLLYFAGGPGESAISEGLPLAGGLTSLRRRRDILLVDVRGTGQSAGLFCPELKGPESVQRFLDEYLPTDPIRACRDRLKQRADLSWYTTDAAVDDVEELRTALGYGPVNLLGSSYGTRPVLTYLRRHPASVRTAMLDGVTAPDARLPLGTARAAQRVLDGLIAECQGDPPCRGAFPKLQSEVDAVFRRAAANPVEVAAADPDSGERFRVRLSRPAVAQTLRYMLYSPESAALVPLQVHQAAQGDWRPLAQSAHLFGGIMSDAAVGFYQSVVCAEDVAFLQEKEIAPAVAGTFLGDFRIRRQQAACQGWPVRDLGPEVLAPVVSDVPCLLISGERDPATPPADAERVAKTLKRARHFVVQDGAHSKSGMGGRGCLPGLLTALIEAGTTQGLDISCLARMKRPDFELPAGKAR